MTVSHTLRRRTRNGREFSEPHRLHRRPTARLCRLCAFHPTLGHHINRLPYNGEADRWFDPAWLVAGGHRPLRCALFIARRPASC